MQRGKQKILAEESGLSEAFISYIVNGKKRPNWETGKTLSEVTGIPIDVWMEQDLAKIHKGLEEWEPKTI
jgi:transcriptional regulator with XRE-family HTH domain